MLLTFLNHQWIAFRRSRGKGTNIAVQVILGIAILYLLVCALIAGIFMGDVLPRMFPNKDTIVVFNGLILYYFVLEFISRLQLQELPTLAIVPYLHLNIPKAKIISFLNIRALFSAFNLIPLFIFFPFCILNISHTLGLIVALMYMLSILSLSVFNNYLALYVKRVSMVNIFFVATGLALLIILGLLEYFNIFSITTISNILFSRIAIWPALALVFPVLATVIFLVNSRYLSNNLYIEELSSGEKKKSSTEYPFLDRFGEVGTLAAVEVKLILRNKRSKSAVSKGLLFIFYGFLFYKSQFLNKNEFTMMIFAAVFMTGNMIMLYGQFMFGWQSSEFDGILTSRVSIKNFIKAKFLLFTLSSSALTLVVSLYGFISWKILLIQFAAYFYSIGIATVMVLYIATRNYKGIDLSKGSSFNFQGVGATSMIMGLPVLLTPIGIYALANYIANPYWGLAILGGLGLIGLLTRSFWVDFLVKEFNKRKYKIAEGFREK